MPFQNNYAPDGDPYQSHPHTVSRTSGRDIGHQAQSRSTSRSINRKESYEMQAMPRSPTMINTARSSGGSRITGRDSIPYTSTGRTTSIHENQAASPRKPSIRNLRDFDVGHSSQNSTEYSPRSSGNSDPYNRNYRDHNRGQDGLERVDERGIIDGPHPNRDSDQSRSRKGRPSASMRTTPTRVSSRTMSRQSNVQVDRDYYTIPGVPIYTPTNKLTISPFQDVGKFIPEYRGVPASAKLPVRPPLTFKKKVQEAIDPRGLADIPPPLLEGNEAWWCCFCENANPVYFDICMICETMRCMLCKSWFVRRTTYLDREKTAWIGTPRAPEYEDEEFY